MPFVIQRRSGAETRLRQVPGDLLRIGRGTNADLRLDDDAVALEHAVIRRDEGGYLLADLGSVTGTYLDGRPVQSARLGADQRVEIGGYRLRLQLTAPDDPLFIHVDAVAPAAAETAAAARGPAPPRVDYVAAYGLRRRYLSKALAALALGLVAALAVAAVVAAGRTVDFRPGGTAGGHEGVVAAADCGACHAPWRGPEDGRCAECHRAEAAPHQAGQVFTPACAGCHAEHRGRDRLTVAPDGRCVACHGELTLAGGGEPRFARRVTSFATGHPEFALAVGEGGGGPGRSGGAAGAPPRLAVGEPAARRADPTRLRFNHRVHLAPRLLAPEGPVQLVCGDCHRPDAATGAMRPIAFADHCQRCHLLTFDAGFPAEQAPHAPPEQVDQYLLWLYTTKSRNPTEPIRYREFRTFVLQGRGRDAAPGVRRRASDAANHLFGKTCAKCHAMDFDAGPLPRVEPPGVPATWFSYARFTHLPHERIECATCHAGAAASTDTAEVLLPGIATCRRCHGGGEALAGEPVVLGCADCHRYHPAAPATPLSP